MVDLGGGKTCKATMAGSWDENAARLETFRAGDVATVQHLGRMTSGALRSAVVVEMHGTARVY